MGYVFGLLIRKPEPWKFIIFLFFGVFVYEELSKAGLLASASFMAGIMAHFVRPFDVSSFFERFRRERDIHIHIHRPEGSGGSQNSRNENDSAGSKGDHTEESPQDSADRYKAYKKEREDKEKQKAHEDSTDNSRGYTSRDSSKRSKPKGSSSKRSSTKREDDLEEELRKARKAQERAERERDDAKKRSTPPPDARTPKEILGLSGDFTLADLKKARNDEIRRWHPDKLRNKPPHLVAQAEEEVKKINQAYDKIKKDKFKGQ